MGAKFRSPIVSVVLAGLFFATGCLFLGTFEKFLQLRSEYRRSQKTYGLLKERAREVDRKRRILARVKAFVEKAHALKLEKRRWDSYEVEIKEPVSYERAREILNQTVSGGNYYFKPSQFRIAKDLKSDGKPGGENSPSPAGASVTTGDSGDIYLNLKGSFLARAR